MYYPCITRSAYFPVNRRLHWESKGEREREQGKEREREQERVREREREWADSLSGHFIWNMNSYMISVCTSSWSLHLTTLGGVNLIAYLGTPSENFDSYLILVTSSDKLGGMSDTLSGYLIWKFELAYYLCHFIWQVMWGVYLTAYQVTLSENFELTYYLGHFIWQVRGLSDLVEHCIWKLGPAKMRLYQYYILHLVHMNPHSWNFSSNISSNVKLAILDH